VNSNSVPDTGVNSIEAYWPGDAYVDYPAIDGYNFGSSASWSRWGSFGSVIDNAYSRIGALTSKPVIIPETGCVEQGGSKAAWIGDMFNSIRTKYTRIAGVCWFNVNDGQDWRVDSTSASQAAFRAQVAQGF
jgi:beta-mannanase